jgi:hypothetical protein
MVVEDTLTSAMGFLFPQGCMLAAMNKVPQNCTPNDLAIRHRILWNKQGFIRGALSLIILGDWEEASLPKLAGQFHRPFTVLDQLGMLVIYQPHKDQATKKILRRSAAYEKFSANRKKHVGYTTALASYFAR